ncbi:hypothetical protein PTSG_03779 [Salpingoeca rosetta]|uniref:Cytochrome P450 n=1 Tax=Salpingoeca rosetta (strain ATCC 50818 / BSB-021) TaxID=946362 RepID=F2U5D1_SALR5|nr:uncharacterized protein PTSG_03779 [Salpingoeca rosetta]EGD83147.1 hypothetical protein PTSG_03779 [Salpingoeca rosetta]|eukprot:XP_004995511.1 hypothetical protein PTSG_03779 [Salpingoeca rosetta]
MSTTSTTSPPGSAGWAVVGDQSFSLWRDTQAFFTSQIEAHGRIFLTRLLNAKTIVVCSANAGRQCLLGGAGAGDTQDTEDNDGCKEDDRDAADDTKSQQAHTSSSHAQQGSASSSLDHQHNATDNATDPHQHHKLKHKHGKHGKHGKHHKHQIHRKHHKHRQQQGRAHHQHHQHHQQQHEQQPTAAKLERQPAGCPAVLDRASAYRPFVEKVYGSQCMLLTPKSSAHPEIAALHRVFARPETCAENLALLEAWARQQVQQLSEAEAPFDLYQELKALCVAATLTLFLGLEDGERDLLHRATQLITTHWHGLTSLPIRLNLGFGKGSGLDQALDAKEELETIIKGRILRCKPVPHQQFLFHIVQACQSQGLDVTCRHLLLFISALIPKALASLLTSMVVELFTSHPDTLERARSDDQFLERFLTETERLHPPFLAARRTLPKDAVCNIGPYRVEGERVIMCIFSEMNKDPDVYKNPEAFDADRWLDASLPKPMTFGWGPDRCMGQPLARHLLLMFARQLLHHINRVDFEEPPSLSPKWLPVARPRSQINACFRK